MSPTDPHSDDTPLSNDAGRSSRREAVQAYLDAEEAAAGKQPQAPPPAPPRERMTVTEQILLGSLLGLSAVLVILGAVKAGELLLAIATHLGLR